MKRSNFQFLNPYVTNSSFTLNPDFEPEKYDDGFEMQNNFGIEIKKDENENKANVTLSLTINEGDMEAPFQLQISVASVFTWEQIKEERINSMLNVNAPALLLGYIRPIVAFITNSSGLPPYNIPFVNFNE